MPKAIIIGASSGIGYELAKILAAQNYELGLVARRFDLLENLLKELSGKNFIKQIDVSHTAQAIPLLNELFTEMGNVDLIIVSSGKGFLNQELEWEKEKETIDVNVTGFCAMVNVAMHHFIHQGYGHIVGISSIAALGGGDVAPAYHASKAFESNYLEGLQKKTSRYYPKIYITDIKPGYVDTPMALGERKFWVSSPEEAAKQIYQDIKKKRKLGYITRRWRLIAWAMKLSPSYFYNKFS